jgi:hypothetical protein
VYESRPVAGEVVVILAARDRRAIQMAEERIAALNDRVPAHLRPDLPDLVSFVSRLYYASREQIMRTLDLTARAYRMWSLSDRELLAEAYGGTGLADIHQETLAAASNTILSAYGEAIENFRTNTTPFPANAKDKGVGPTACRGIAVEGPAANFASRSRIRHRNRCPCPSRSITRFPGLLRHPRPGGVGDDPPPTRCTVRSDGCVWG